MTCVLLFVIKIMYVLFNNTDNHALSLFQYVKGQSIGSTDDVVLMASVVNGEKRTRKKSIQKLVIGTITNLICLHNIENPLEFVTSIDTYISIEQHEMKKNT